MTTWPRPDQLWSHPWKRDSGHSAGDENDSRSRQRFFLVGKNVKKRSKERFSSLPLPIRILETASKDIFFDEILILNMFLFDFKLPFKKCCCNDQYFGWKSFSIFFVSIPIFNAWKLFEKSHFSFLYFFLLIFSLDFFGFFPTNWNVLFWSGNAGCRPGWSRTQALIQSQIEPRMP